MKGAITLFQQMCEDVKHIMSQIEIYADRTSMTKSDKVRHSILKNVCENKVIQSSMKII